MKQCKVCGHPYYIVNTRRIENKVSKLYICRACNKRYSNNAKAFNNKLK